MGAEQSSAQLLSVGDLFPLGLGPGDRWSPGGVVGKIGKLG